MQTQKPVAILSPERTTPPAGTRRSCWSAFATGALLGLAVSGVWAGAEIMALKTRLRTLDRLRYAVEDMRDLQDEMASFLQARLSPQAHNKPDSFGTEQTVEVLDIDEAGDVAGVIHVHPSEVTSDE